MRLFLLFVPLILTAQVPIGGGGGGGGVSPGAPNQFCTFAGGATSCGAVNVATLNLSSNNRIVVQCFTGASTTQTPLALTTYTYTTGSGIVQTVTANFSAAGAAGYCTINATGSAGAQGIQGIQGIQGNTGPQGAPGANGADGTSVTVATEAAGSNCTYGGQKLTSVSGTSYVCNGAPGGGGGGSLSSYSCNLTNVSAVTCNHALNTNIPMVWCNDSTGKLLGSDGSAGNVTSIAAISPNSTSLTFSAALSGTCMFACANCSSTISQPSLDYDTATYANDVSVTPSSSTPNVVFCYTTNGTDPAAISAGTCSTGSTYSGTPISITATGTNLKVLGTLAGYTNSSIKSATYTLTVASVVASPTPPYSGTATNVSLSNTTTSSVIHYRTDGVAAGCGDTTYTTPIAVNSTTTITAIACKTNYNNSSAFSGTYTISSTAGTPTFSPAAGTYTGTQSVTISTATSTCASYIYWNTTGSPTSGDNHGTSVSVTTSETVYAKVIGCPGYTDSAVGSAAYTINGSATLISHTQVQSNGTTSPAISTTGASLIVISGTCYAADQSPTTPTDSNSNVYTALTHYHNGFSGQNVRLYYKLAPTTSASTTFSVNATNCNNGMIFIDVFSGVTQLVVGSDTGNTASGGTSVSIAAYTPSQANELIISAYGVYDPGVTNYSVNNSMTLDESSNYAGAGHGGLAHLVYGSTSPITVTWSSAGGMNPIAVAMASFK